MEKETYGMKKAENYWTFLVCFVEDCFYGLNLQLNSHFEQ